MLLSLLNTYQTTFGKHIGVLGMILLSACKAIPPEIKPALSKNSPRDITVFIDGTSNTKIDTTNIYKLFELSKISEKRASFYTVGVGGGLDFKISGNIFGTGIGNDVRDAYLYICKTYDKSRQDRLHFFGFSRGAYAAQILSNLIYVAGILDITGLDDKIAEQFIKELYRAYRGKGDFGLRKKKVNRVIARWERKLRKNIKFQSNIEIESLNLFDTVEALTAPDYSENQCYPNPNHMRQFQNIKHVNHALSLDDNRARIFTPILSTCNEIAISKAIDSVVKEVWFAGAHSDIGGGYKYSENNRLSKVSLSWMMGQLNDYKLFDRHDFRESDDLELIHDAERSSFLTRLIYKRLQRDIPRYLRENNQYYNNGKLLVHESVIRRLREGLYKAPKLPSKRDTIWYDRLPFRQCFKKDGESRFFQADACDVIQIISTKK